MKVVKCDKCEVFQAVVHVTEIEDGQTKERSLCDECAQKEGVVCSSSKLKAENLQEIIKRKIEEARKQKEERDRE